MEDTLQKILERLEEANQNFLAMRADFDSLRKDTHRLISITERMFYELLLIKERFANEEERLVLREQIRQMREELGMETDAAEEDISNFIM